MINIRIGSEEHKLEEIDERWIADQIVRRRRDGERVCVQVRIDVDRIHIGLATPTCARGGGGLGRSLTTEERELVDLWHQLHLNTDEFSPGNVLAFVKRIASLN